MDFKQQLEKIDKQFYGSDEILGKNLLTMANHLNSSRAFMFSNMLDQIVPLEETEIPYVHTGHEKLIGKYSCAIERAKSNYEVVSKIVKFPNSPNSIYTLVVYDKTNDTYDVIERKPGEKLTETYGYKYANKMDKYEPGDKIKKDSVLYHSTSYSEDGELWGYGKNALVIYTLDPMTIEDPIRFRKGFADSLVSIEYDVVRIGLNDNDLLINLYGDRNNYKSFPDIGEHVKNATIAARRRITYSSALFDLKESNMRKILSTDTPFYVPFAKDTIVDINVFCNNPEGINDAKYNTQIKYYYDCEIEYYKQIKDALEPIIETSSDNYTNKLSYLYSKVKDILDPEVKWKDVNNRVFNNVIIELLVEKRVGTVKGSKYAGRYGNKGVISSITPDEEMPVTEDGRVIDVVINLLGVGNRLNSGQLNEVELNFQAEEIRKMMESTTDKYTQERLLFDFLDIVSKDYSKDLQTWYYNLSEEEQEEFIQNTIDDHIYIEQPPMYNNAGFKEICEVYDTFGIKPINVYVHKFGRMIKLMTPMVVGHQYMIKLKHHPKSKSSARSTGYLNSKDLPIKTSSVQDNRTILQPTAIKIGDMEALNLLLNNNPDALVKMNMLYASSPMARRDIGQIYEKGFVDIELNPDARNRNIEIFRVDNKMLGTRLRFVKDSNK